MFTGFTTFSYDPYSFLGSKFPTLKEIIAEPQQLFLSEHFYAGIGILTLLPLSIKAIKSLYYYLRARSPSKIGHLYRPSVVPGQASWVVVTGATGGIGEAYCKLFAQEGLNIVAIARSPENLQQLKTQLQTLNPFIQVKLVQVDFSREYSYSIIQEKLKEVTELDVSVLVNNVGVLDCSLFHDLNTTKIYEYIHVNVYTQVYVTKVLIHQLVQRSKTHKTAIINISSNFGKSLVFPFYSVYTGTKAFTDHFSVALGAEYPSIDVLSSIPGMTKSKSKPMGYDTDDQVKKTVRFLGLKKRTHGPIDHYIGAVYLTKFYPFERKGLRKGMLAYYEAEIKKHVLKKPDLPLLVSK